MLVVINHFTNCLSWRTLLLIYLYIFHCKRSAHIFIHRIRSPITLLTGAIRTVTTLLGVGQDSTTKKPNFRPIGTRRSPRSALAWKWVRARNLLCSRKRPVHCIHLSLMGVTDERHLDEGCGNLWLRAHLYSGIAGERGLTVLTLKVRRLESVLLETRRMIASRLTHLLALVLYFHPVGVGTMHKFMQTTAIGKLVPMATSLYSSIEMIICLTLLKRQMNE